MLALLRYKASSYMRRTSKIKFFVTYVNSNKEKVGLPTYMIKIEKNAYVSFKNMEACARKKDSPI